MSLNVLDRNLHVKEFEAPIITICVSMEATCSWGSLIPLNSASKGCLKLSWTPPINLVRERLEIHKFCLLIRIFLFLVLLEVKDIVLQSLVWRHKSSIAACTSATVSWSSLKLLSTKVAACLFTLLKRINEGAMHWSFINRVAHVRFTMDPRWTTIVLTKMHNKDNPLYSMY